MRENKETRRQRQRLFLVHAIVRVPPRQPADAHRRFCFHLAVRLGHVFDHRVTTVRLVFVVIVITLLVDARQRRRDVDRRGFVGTAVDRRRGRVTAGVGDAAGIEVTAGRRLVVVSRWQTLGGSVFLIY